MKMYNIILLWYNVKYPADFHLIYYATITIQFWLKPNRDQIRNALMIMFSSWNPMAFVSSLRMSQNTSELPSNPMMCREDTFCVIFLAN